MARERTQSDQRMNLLTSRGCRWLTLADPVRARPVALVMLPSSCTCTCRGGAAVLSRRQWQALQEVELQELRQPM